MPDDLDKLAAQLDQIQADRNKAETKRKAQDISADNMTQGVRAGVELMSPIIAGGFLGWGLDHWLGSAPAGLIVMLVLGVVTGFYNVWRVTQNIGSTIGFSELHRRKKDAKTLPAEKDQA